MPIARNEDWGEPGALAEDAPVATSDAALVAAVREDLDAGRIPEVGLLGGDLHRTLGAPRHDEAGLRAGGGVRLPMDVAAVTVFDPDGAEHRSWFCAHLVAVEGGGALFAHRSVVAMNASFLGDADLGPRAHPNDGLLEVTDGRLGWWDRRRAHSRMATGTHVPHPDLSERRVRTLDVAFTRPAVLSLDGEDRGHCDRIEVRVVPDGLLVVV